MTRSDHSASAEGSGGLGYVSPANCSNNSTNQYCLSDDDYLDLIETYIFPSVFEWLLIILSTAIFFIGTIGNVLVIISVVRNPSMRSVTNYFIVNLSLADFLVLIVCLPPTIIWDITETWFLGSIMCRAVLFCQRVCVSVSVMTFLCIAVDRWYAIVLPLTISFASTAFRAKIAVLLTWILAISVSLPELVYLDIAASWLPLPSIYFTQCVAHWNETEETAYQIFILIAFYIIPISAMTVLYGQIVYALWWRALPQAPGASVSPTSNTTHRHSSHQTQPNGHSPLSPTGTARTRSGSGFYVNGKTPTGGLPGTNSSQAALVDNQIRSRRKVAAMLILTVALFAFCYLPVHTLNVLRSTVGLPNTPIWVTISLLVHWICYMQNASNPIIYYVMSEKFRREFNRIFQCCIDIGPKRHVRRNSSEVFQCPRAQGQPTYYHTLGLGTQKNSYANKSSDAHNVIVQL